MGLSQLKLTQSDMQYSVFYRLLLAPRCRLWRYVALCLLFLLFSFAETGYNYDMQSHGTVPLMMLCLIGVTCKVATTYVLVRFVMPRLLFGQRYAAFWRAVVGSIVLFIFLQYGLESVSCRHYGMTSFRGAFSFYHLLDFCIQIVQWLIVFMGLSMGYLLRYWTDEMQRKQRMETSRLQMETELLKEQVTPELLCETLNRSGAQALSEPSAASERLMLLSRLLRYQLYDCRRKEVLLESEVKFLRDYLALLERNGECAGYTLAVAGQIWGVFVPPLLFVLFVRPEKAKIGIAFTVSGNCLDFRVTGNCSRIEECKARRRLDDVYAQRYTLSVSSQNASLTIERI